MRQCPHWLNRGIVPIICRRLAVFCLQIVWVTLLAGCSGAIEYVPGESFTLLTPELIGLRVRGNKGLWCYTEACVCFGQQKSKLEYFVSRIMTKCNRRMLKSYCCLVLLS